MGGRAGESYGAIRAVSGRGRNAPLEIERARVHQGNVICKFRGVDSIESAQAYKGRIVYTDKDERSLAPGEYYIADVIGLTVVDADTGEKYGRLTDVYQAPANDAYEIELASAGGCCSRPSVTS